MVMKTFRNNLLHFYLKNKVALICSTAFVLSLFAYAYYSFITGTTGERIEHKGKVVGVSVLQICAYRTVANLLMLEIPWSLLKCLERALLIVIIF